ncbi:tetratricopeptide repeat protein [Falsibacillus albus]|uniref:Tetratricopeptide repeat protein n=1 Tax=Falsibacillus albus TaxID=2478915 RepID=A0A3L7K787_9BACI|nr:tetratricopeptide repeat protein [Falsibacillus albus]RLQ98021.1 tetratricopeptide repeat protein [Falsibacillus albus]
MSKEKKNQENIILFPNLKERYLDIGLEHLNQHRFHEAVEFLQKALQLSEGRGDGDIEMALAIALYESRSYKEAKNICQELLHKGIGDYFEVVDLYLMILLQLNEHQEIESTIRALLEEREVPSEKLEHFEKLLQFSERALYASSPQVEENDDDNEELNLSNQVLLEGRNVQEQALLLAQLAQKNIHPYLKELKSFLKDNKQHPFLQTMALNVLKEHAIGHPVEISKFDYTDEVIPSQLDEVFANDFFIEIKEELEREIGQSNPTLFDQCMELVKRHEFLLYPFDLPEASPKLAAAAYHLLMLEYYGEDRPAEVIAEQYGADEEGIHKPLAVIRNLEEISSPIM